MTLAWSLSLISKYDGSYGSYEFTSLDSLDIKHLGPVL